MIVIKAMDVLICKEDYFVHSIKGGLTTTFYQDLLALECDKPLVRFRLKDSIFSLKASLCDIEKHLDVFFIRINRQIIINIKFAKQIICKQGGYWIQMEGGREYKISERRKRVVCLLFTRYV